MNCCIVNYIVALLVVLGISNSGYAQNTHDHYVSATVFNENIGVPFDMKNGAPLHLGGTISFGRSRRLSRAYRYANIFQAGYYHHDNLHEVLFLVWKPTFQVSLFDIIEFHATVGLGYAHSFPTEQTYRLIDRRYEKRPNRGKSHVMPSVGGGVGLNMETIINVPVTAFARYEAFGLGPYAADGLAPFTINTMAHLGLKYVINKNN